MICAVSGKSDILIYAGASCYRAYCSELNRVFLSEYAYADSPVLNGSVFEEYICKLLDLRLERVERIRYFLECCGINVFSYAADFTYGEDYSSASCVLK